MTGCKRTVFYLINKIKKMLSSAFVKQVFTLSAGTAVAQAITVIILPILTPIYTPSPKRIYSLFLSSVYFKIQISFL